MAGREPGAFQQRGWIETDGGQVRITAMGALIVSACQPLVDTIADTTELAPFRRWFPHDEFALDRTALADGEVTASTVDNPDAPASQQIERVLMADRFRRVLPSVDREDDGRWPGELTPRGGGGGAASAYPT